MSTVVKDLGPVTAYADAVAAGYTGTKEEWQALMASYASVAEEAQEAKEGAEAAQEAAESARDAAIDAKEGAEDAVDGFGAVVSQATNQAVQTVRAEGTTQVGNVSSEGTTQVNAVQAKGAEVLQSIPADYTELSNDVVQLKQDLTAEETARANAVSAEATAREAADDAINAELATKADADGTIASAEQLLSEKYTTDQEPYTFRTSGGSGADREYDEIVGGSIVWNQLIQNDYSNTTKSTLVDKSVSNNEATITSNANTAGVKGLYIALTAGHVYYGGGLFKTSGTTGAIGFRANVGTSINAGSGSMGWTETATYQSMSHIAKTTASDDHFGIFINNASTANSSGTFKDVCAIDLTQMFGTTIADYIYGLEQATAGAGVAFFKKLFPKDYYEYDAGTMMHVSDLQSHDTVGFNQWDEEWEVGDIDSAGQNTTGTATIRSKNYISVIPSTTYYANISSVSTSVRISIFGYDANKNFIGKIVDGVARRTFDTPSNVRYIRFRINSFYGTTYHNDICFNLSWDGERNGEYEPYVKHSYPLDDSLTLRGIPKLDSNNQLYYDGDTYAADGTVTRKYGVVDLGTLNWYLSTTGTSTFLCEDSYRTTTRAADFVCPKFANSGIVSSDYMPDKSIQLFSTGNYFAWAKDSAYTDAASFKTAMSGVYLVYELATSTTEEAEPYNEVQIVDDFGTEEYVTTSLVPVGHNTKYPANLRSAIERVMEQVPEAPSANGTYTLKATRTASGVTYAWTAE